MTPGNHQDPRSTDVQDAAARTLGVVPDCSPEAVRAAFLRAVRDDDFMPGPHIRDAFDVLRGRSTLLPGSWLLEEVHWNENTRLRNAVEEFASFFFSTPVAERIKRWEELSAATLSKPGLHARIKNLEPGLQLDLATVVDRSAEVEELARLACELFILPPKARAIRRQECLVELSARTKRSGVNWRAAARRIRRVYPDIAKLAPELFLALLTPPSIHRRSARRPPLGAAPAPSTTGPNSSWWKYVLIIVVVTNVFRAISGLSTSRTGPNPPVSPVPKGAPIPSFLLDPPKIRNTPKPPRDQVERFLKSNFRTETGEFRARPLDDNELEEIFQRVTMTRDLHSDPQKRRRFAIAQLTRELIAHGVFLSNKRTNEIYDAYFEPGVPKGETHIPGTTSTPPPAPISPGTKTQ